MQRRLATTWLLGLSFLPAAAMLAQTESPPIRRWSADEIECPGGTELHRVEAPDGSRSALWCEAVRGSQVARHGPYLELYADGSTARQGLYVKGVQAGHWVSFSPGGAVASERVLLPGEAGRYIPQPEDLCPPGSKRERSRGYDHRERLWSKCTAIGDDGKRVMVGPYVTWDAEKGPDGAPRYVLRSIMTYENGERHGPHRVFEGPFAHEALVEDETFVDGHPEGESRAYYLDGSMRELRHYRDGQLDGERIGYYPDGTERWRVVYEKGRRVAAEGDLSVAGQPCPEPNVPTTSADGLKEACAHRYLHFLQRDGAFVERDETGRVIESGLYEADEKVELWQAPPGVELPPEVPDEVLVAEIQLLIGERPFQGSPVQPSAFEVWFRNNETKKYPRARTVVEDGVVKVYGLSPGRYYVQVNVDAEPANGEQHPGDLTASLDFAVELGEVTQLDAQLLYTLHLTEPWDNNEDIPGWGQPCGEKTRLPGPPHFAWKPPAGEDPTGIEYVYRLSRQRCDPFVELEVMAAGATYETSLDVSLPPSRRGEVYEWSLIAKRGDRAIGQLMAFGGNGYGWSVCFRVE